MKFLHAMLRVSELQKSLEFYTKLFGLKLSYTANLEDCTLYYLKDEITGVEIELTDNFKKPENKYLVGETFGHFAFEVDNFDEFSKKVEDMGYQYLYEPFDLTLNEGDNKRVLKIAFIKDPDGNEIEIIEKNEA